MLRSAKRAACGVIRAGSRRQKDTADMATYAAKESLLTQQAQSDMRSELLYPDLHGSQWQPAEKKLIGFSLGIGLALLAALVIVNHVF